MADRTRSSGWQFAKTSGEAWEGIFCLDAMRPASLIGRALRRDLARLGLSTTVIAAAEVPGMVNTVLGDRSFGKPDVEVVLDDGDALRISLKKPSTPSGQAHLQTLSRFLEAWPLIHRDSLPTEVVKVLTLFAGAPAKCSLATWAGVDETNFSDVELRHLKLYPRTISKLFATEWGVFLGWLEAEAESLLDYCMFTGSASSSADHATHLYLGQQERLLSREELGRALHKRAHPIVADMTIHLPWGFLQTHNPRGANKERSYPNQLQFHWEGTKLVTLASG